MSGAILRGFLLLALGSVSAAAPLLIRGARVFDGEAMLGKRDVLVTSGKIAAVAPRISPPSDAVIVEAQGSTLLPGLFESHAHIADGGYYLRTAALFGITTVIDLFTAGPGNTPHEIHERVRLAPPANPRTF
jgi:dihydroorotase-like cyclic amidohydrolase